MTVDRTLFDRLGGKSTLSRVHQIFYDKVYGHAWMSQYFVDKPRETLERQQTDFMGQLFGGPKAYAGKSPKVAHQHMVITEELFRLRSAFLEQSLIEAGIAEDLRQEWIAADMTFMAIIVKESESQCVRAYTTQEILNFRRPAYV